jgi:hypothetical protein
MIQSDVDDEDQDGNSTTQIKRISSGQRSKKAWNET